MHLDTRTLVVVAIFVALVPSVIGALIWHARQTCPGFGRWTLGNFVLMLAMVFLSLRGIAPDWGSIVLANALVIGSGILVFQGIRLFRGLRLYLWPEYLTGVLAISAVIYFRYVTNNINLRILAMGLWIGICGLACGVMLLRAAPAGRRFSMFFTGNVFMLVGTANLLRGIYVYTQSPVTDLLVPSLANSAFFGGASLCVVSWSFGFILMNGERLVTDSKETFGRPTMPAPESNGRAHVDRAVPAAEVLQQVQRIIKSDGFRRSARMERFLTLAVERALMGRPEELKEYALGRDVFNRGSDYDPREDSIVRVEAQRLRRKLREYYDSSGRDDLVIVEFRSGSYVPAFRYRTLTERCDP
jgi:hypothetical protein